MQITVSGGGSVSGERSDYISRKKLAPHEGRVRPLFSHDEDDLTINSANQILSNGRNRPENDNQFEIVASLKEKKTFLKLGETVEERMEAYRAIIRKGLAEMFNELGVKDVRYIFAVHLNTDNPHAHIVIAKDVRDIETDANRVLETIPRPWFFSHGDHASKAAAFFETALKERSLPVAPPSVMTLPASSKVRATMPRRADDNLLSQAEYNKAVDFLLHEREIAPATVEEALRNKSLYASEYGHNVFVHRDPAGYATGYTLRDNSTSDAGHFYIGNPRTARRFVLVQTPVEALSLYDLTANRDLSEVCFVSLAGNKPQDSLINHINARSQKAHVRVIWAMPLDTTGEQDKESFTEMKERLQQLHAEAGEKTLEVVTFAPQATFGRTWNALLVQKHLQGELKAIQRRAQNAELPEAKPDQATTITPNDVPTILSTGPEEFPSNVSSVTTVEAQTVEETPDDQTLDIAHLSYAEATAERLHELQLANELGDFSDNGGDIISYYGEPVGWFHTDADGTLDAIEIRDEYRRRGIALQVIKDTFMEGSFRAFAFSTDAGRGLLMKYGVVTEDGDGFVTVIPHALNQSAAMDTSPATLSETRDVPAVESRAVARESMKEKTNAVRNTPLPEVMRALGLHKQEIKGEGLYTDAGNRFRIKLKDDLFTDRKNGNEGGRGALDLVMYVHDTDFTNARNWLVDTFYNPANPRSVNVESVPANEPPQSHVSTEPKPLKMPPANDARLNVVRSYLTTTRGIAPGLIEDCIANGSLYANSMSSAVFVHRDVEGVVTGATWRATDSHLRGNAPGTRLGAGWFYLGDLRTARTFVLVEAPIEALSFLDLNRTQDLSQTAIISLAGSSAPKELLQYISEREGARIIVALNNDSAGNKGHTRVEKNLSEINFTGEVERLISRAEDWNEELKAVNEEARRQADQEHIETELQQADDAANEVTGWSESASIEPPTEEAQAAPVIVSPPVPDGWILETVNDNNITQHSLRSERFTGYQIALYLKPDGNWSAEILTRQTRGGSSSWEPQRKSFGGTIERVVAEVERRGRYWEQRNTPQQSSVQDTESVTAIPAEELVDAAAQGAPTISRETVVATIYEAVRNELKNGQRVKYRFEASSMTLGIEGKNSIRYTAADLIEVYTTRAGWASISDYTLNEWARERNLVGPADLQQSAFAPENKENEENEQPAINDRASDEGATRIPPQVAANSDGLSGRVEATGIPEALIGEQSSPTGIEAQRDGQGDGRGVVEPATEQRPAAHGIRDRAGDLSPLPSGTGRVGAGSEERFDRPNDGSLFGNQELTDAQPPAEGIEQGAHTVKSEQPGESVQTSTPAHEIQGAVTAQQEAVNQTPAFATFVMSDDYSQRSYLELTREERAARSDSRRAVVELLQGHGIDVCNHYLRGTISTIDAAARALAQSELPATVFPITTESEMLLARIAGKEIWEITLDEYTAQRHYLSIRNYVRGVKTAQDELNEILTRKPASNSKQVTTLRTQIELWSRVIENNDEHLERKRPTYKKEYEATVAKAISTGQRVSAEIIAQSPAFRTAQTNRERYEKGWKTSFANVSQAINDSMLEERGYKVKRQDGKEITPAQINEIAAGMDEIEKVFGSCAELMRTGNVTFAHTSGKHPFLSDAGGVYHTTERTITIGIRSRLSGRLIPSQAHEWGHWLDNEAGTLKQINVVEYTKSRKRVELSYLSEGDNQHRYGAAISDGQGDDNLINDATRSMTRTREVDYILKIKNDRLKTDEERIEKELIEVKLGHYWRRPREVWARLVEQYVSTKLNGEVLYSAEKDYTRQPAYWSAEDFAKLEPRIEKEINRRLELVRAGLTPEAARMSGTATPLTPEEEAEQHTPLILNLPPVAVVETTAQAEAASIESKNPSPQAAATTATSFKKWLEERGIDPKKFAPNRKPRPADSLLIEEGHLRLEHFKLLREAGLTAPDASEENTAIRARIEAHLPNYVTALEREFKGRHTRKSVSTKQFLLGALGSLDSLDGIADFIISSKTDEVIPPPQNEGLPESDEQLFVAEPLPYPIAADDDSVIERIVVPEAANATPVVPEESTGIEIENIPETVTQINVAEAEEAGTAILPIESGETIPTEIIADLTPTTPALAADVAATTDSHDQTNTSTEPQSAVVEEPLNIPSVPFPQAVENAGVTVEPKREEKQAGQLTRAEYYLEPHGIRRADDSLPDSDSSEYFAENSNSSYYLINGDKGAGTLYRYETAEIADTRTVEVARRLLEERINEPRALELLGEINETHFATFEGLQWRDVEALELDEVASSGGYDGIRALNNPYFDGATVVKIWNAGHAQAIGDANHKYEVEAAVDNGLTVAPEVLADYPDLETRAVAQMLASYDEEAKGDEGQAGAEAEAAEEYDGLPEQSIEPVNENYVLTDINIHSAGIKTKFKQNVDAILLLRQIEEEERAATPAEKETIARFCGWGGMKGAFNKYFEDAGAWSNERDILQALLKPDEWEAGSHSVLNAHYTPPVIADSLWEIAERLGFKGGRTLEPAMGIGTILGRVPESLRDTTTFTGIELDNLTARMATVLYPQSQIKAMGFENHHVPDGWFDLLIGNPPFGDYTVYDPPYNKFNASIHDYFFLKGLDNVRDGGLQIFITSTYTLDKQDSRIREHLAKNAKLIGAIRLPADTFQKNAGTSVVTDIIILQKKTGEERRQEQSIKESRQLAQGQYDEAQTRISTLSTRLTSLRAEETTTNDLFGDADRTDRLTQAEAELVAATEALSEAEANLQVAIDVEASAEPNWLHATTVPDPDGGEDIPVNSYYVEHPEMILGRLDRSGKLYGAGTVSVSATADFEERLRAAVESLPRDIYEEAGIAFGAGGVDRLLVDDSIRAGSIQVSDGKLYRAVKMLNGGKELIEDKDIDAGRVRRAERLLEVRDALRSLINGELTDDLNTNELRVKLNDTYDNFVRTYSAISRPINRDVLAGDPDLALLLALEHYDEKTGKTLKADIFEKATVRGYARPTEAAGLNEAIGITLNEYGSLNVRRVADLINTPVEEVEQQMVSEGLAYHDPRTKTWEMRDEYLAGNVRQKLVEAELAAVAEPLRYTANVTALAAVIPADLEYMEIDVRLGSSWVETTDVAEFMAHLVGGEQKDFVVAYTPKSGAWAISFTGSGADRHSSKPAATEIWGTDRADVISVAQHILDGRALIIRDKIRVNGNDEYVVNKEATEAANGKAKDVKEAFKEWIWTDQERRLRLHRKYNDLFNNTAPMKFNGNHLTFPGMATEINGKPFSLRPHQADAVWRTIRTGRAVYAHEVGTGKTYTMVTAAMEMKRLGLVNKPAIACLKANIQQITEDAQKLYPNARILSTYGQFAEAQRKETVSRMATGDYDLVIMTHDHLDRLPMQPATRARNIQDEIDELTLCILQAAERQDGSGKRGRGNRIVAQLKRASARLEADLKDILTKNKDDAVHFEESGIDFLFVDEFHKYKSLKVYTSRGQVKGIPTGRSDRATNMLARIRWLQEQHDGRGIVGATGTPIANTTAELFNLMRYFQWEELKERGVSSFDAWASVFGETVNKIEKTATGEYKDVARFAKFTNLPELLSIANQMMDIKLSRDLPDIKIPRRSDEVITALLSEDQAAYQLYLNDRAKNLTWGSEDNMLVISTEARLMSLDIRLVEPDAEDRPDSKVNLAIENILRIHRERPEVTQMIFSDIGVHPNDHKFSVYEDIIRKLVDGGIPRERIINFAKLTEKQRETAIQRLATGDALIGIGSTDKLGTGVNAQHRLYAAHNLDVPWLPAYITQRDGRIVRQENMHIELGEAVKVYRYVTVGGFDELMWQTVDRKQGFINSVMQGGADVSKVGRSMKEVDGEELTHAQVAAVASGNPDTLLRIELEDEIGELTRAYRRQTQAQLRLQDEVTGIARRIGAFEDRKAQYEEDNLKYAAANRAGADRARAAHETNQQLRAELDQWRSARNAEVEAGTIDILTFTQELEQRKEETEKRKVSESEFSATIKGREFTSRAEAAVALMAQYNAARNGQVIGQYKGFDIKVYTEYLLGMNHAEMRLIGATTDGYAINFASPEGAFASMEASLRRLEAKIGDCEEQVRMLNVNVAKVQEEIGKPFRDAERLTAAKQELVEVEWRLLIYGKSEEEIKELTAARDGVAITSPEESANVEEVVESNDDSYREDDHGGDAANGYLSSYNAEEVFAGQARVLMGMPRSLYLDDVQFSVDEKGRIMLNPEAHELIRSAYIGGGFGLSKEAGAFAGVFNDPPTVERLLRRLDEIEEEHPAQGKRVRALTAAIAKASAEYDGTAVFYTSEGAILHEELHRGSYMAAQGKSLEDRHGLFDALADSPELNIVRAQLEREYRTNNNGILVEELFAICGAGEAHQYGLTNEQAAEYLSLWFESIAMKNGSLSREEFKELTDESAQIRDDAYERAERDRAYNEQYLTGSRSASSDAGGSIEESVGARGASGSLAEAQRDGRANEDGGSWRRSDSGVTTQPLFRRPSIEAQPFFAGQRHVTPLPENEWKMHRAKELYEEGKSLNFLMKELGASTRTIGEWLNTLGVQKRDEAAETAIRHRYRAEMREAESISAVEMRRFERPNDKAVRRALREYSEVAERAFAGYEAKHGRQISDAGRQAFGVALIESSKSLPTEQQEKSIQALTGFMELRHAPEFDSQLDAAIWITSHQSEKGASAYWTTQAETAERVAEEEILDLNFILPSGAEQSSQSAQPLFKLADADNGNSPTELDQPESEEIWARTQGFNSIEAYNAAQHAASVMERLATGAALNRADALLILEHLSTDERWQAVELAARSAENAPQIEDSSYKTFVDERAYAVEEQLQSISARAETTRDNGALRAETADEQPAAPSERVAATHDLVIVGFETASEELTTSEWELRARYDHVIKAATTTYEALGNTALLSDQVQLAIAEIAAQNSELQPTSEQEQSIEWVAQQLQTATPEFTNRVDAQMWIIQQSDEWREQWTKNIVTAAQSLSASKERTDFTNTPPERAVRTTRLALDLPSTDDSSRNLGRVKYISLTPTELFDPHGLVDGSHAERSRRDERELERRMYARAGRQDTKREDILTEMGYLAEARDATAGDHQAAPQREIVLFKPERARTISTDVKAQEFNDQRTEWQHEAVQMADRETIGEQLATKLELAHAQYQLKSANEQGDVRRYKIKTNDGERRLSVRDIEQQANAVARRYVAQHMDASLAAEQNKESGQRRSARELRMEMQKEAIETELSEQRTILDEIRAKHAASITRFERELSKATTTHAEAQANAQQVLVEYDRRSESQPRAYITPDRIDLLHDDAVIRGDAPTIIMLDDKRREQARETKDTPALRTESVAARLIGQERLAQVGLATAERRAEAFEETSHLRRFEIEGKDRNAYLNKREQRQTDEPNYEWSLKDVESAKQEAEANRSFHDRRANFYEQGTHFSSFFAQQLNPLRSAQSDLRFLTHPFQALRNHLDPLRIIGNDPVIRTGRFIWNYLESQQQVKECRRLSELEARKSAALDEIKEQITAKIEISRAELTAEVTSKREMLDAISTVVGGEQIAREAAGVEMPAPSLREHEIRQLGASAMELRDGELLKDYKQFAEAAQAQGLLPEEHLGARAVGRETVAAARLLDAELKLISLNQTIGKEGLTAREVLPVKIEIAGEERVMSLRDAARAPEAVQNLVNSRLDEHEQRLIERTAQEQKFYEQTRAATAEYTNALTATGDPHPLPQFSVKEHIEIERFAAGVEDNELHMRFEQIASSALRDGRVLDINAAPTSTALNLQEGQIAANTVEAAGESTGAANASLDEVMRPAQSALNALTANARAAENSRASELLHESIPTPTPANELLSDQQPPTIAQLRPYTVSTPPAAVGDEESSTSLAQKWRTDTSLRQPQGTELEAPDIAETAEAAEAIEAIEAEEAAGLGFLAM